MKNIYTIISAFLITSLAYTMLGEIDFTEDFDEVEFFDDFDEKMTEKKAKKSIDDYIKESIESYLVTSTCVAISLIYLTKLILVENPDFKSLALILLAGSICWLVGLGICSFYNYIIAEKVFRFASVIFYIGILLLYLRKEHKCIPVRAPQFRNLALFLLVGIICSLVGALICKFYDIDEQIIFDFFLGIFSIGLVGLYLWVCLIKESPPPQDSTSIKSSLLSFTSFFAGIFVASMGYFICWYYSHIHGQLVSFLSLPMLYIVYMTLPLF